MFTPNINRPFTKFNNCSHVYVHGQEDIRKTEDGYVVSKMIYDYEQEIAIPFERKFKKDEFFFHKYMPFSWAIHNINNSELVFVSPQTWKDPFERLLFDTNHANISCLCMTYEKTANEESVWNTYRNHSIPEDLPVRLSFNPKKFMDLLEDIGHKYHVDFYVTTIDYSCSRKELKNLSKNKASYSSRIETYINAMSLKRKAFAYENELRIFAVPQNEVSKVDYPPKVVSFNIKDILDYKTILSRVTLPPYSPFSQDDKRDKLYSEIQFFANYGMRTYFESFMPQRNVQQSHLYDVYDKTSGIRKKYKLSGITPMVKHNTTP